MTTATITAPRTATISPLASLLILKTITDALILMAWGFADLDTLTDQELAGLLYWEGHDEGAEVFRP